MNKFFSFIYRMLLYCFYLVGCAYYRADNTPLTWSSVNDFVYQLQNIDIQAIGSTAFDLVIIDYSKNGTEENRFSLQEITALKNSSGGPKLVLAYLSIGEAETYRWYWDTDWDRDRDGQPDAGAPSWLGPENPEWEGNYKVKYWESGWQEIIFTYLDKIINAGFDGVYLDIIDAYEYWGPGGESGLNRLSAAEDMVAFVKVLANHARTIKRKPDFGIFPQNGEGLSSFSDYVEVVTGIGKEDTWYNDNTAQEPNYINEVLSHLEVFKQAGKLVLCIDYVTTPPLIDDFYTKARARGFVPYATARSLDTLTVHLQHPPD
ncbi:MAG: MJ1477/TM1410 family putative glycoside hydrolase [Spirochaetales bacterium]